jgi:hypothetical protein
MINIIGRAPADVNCAMAYSQSNRLQPWTMRQVCGSEIYTLENGNYQLQMSTGGCVARDHLNVNRVYIK